MKLHICFVHQSRQIRTKGLEKRFKHLFAFSFSFFFFGRELIIPVRRGDSIASLAKQYNVPKETLMAANDGGVPISYINFPDLVK